MRKRSRHGRLPFEDLFSASRDVVMNETDGDATIGSHKFPGSYSNADLWELFRPDSDTIPYVYDQFEQWGECDWDPLSVSSDLWDDV